MLKFYKLVTGLCLTNISSDPFIHLQGEGDNATRTEGRMLNFQMREFATAAEAESALDNSTIEGNAMPNPATAPGGAIMPSNEPGKGTFSASIFKPGADIRSDQAFIQDEYLTKASFTAKTPVPVFKVV